MGTPRIPEAAERRGQPWEAWWWRIGGAAGILFAGLFLAGSSLQGARPEHTAIEETRRYFIDDGTQYLAGSYLLLIAIALGFLPFLSALYAVLRRAEGQPAVWSRVVLLGGLLMVGLGLAGSAGLNALALGVAETADDATIRVLTYTDFHAYMGMALVAVAFVLPASALFLATGAFPRWLAYFGFAIAAAGLAGAAATMEGRDDSPLHIVGQVSLLLLLIWCFIVAIEMLRIPASTAATEDKKSQVAASPPAHGAAVT